MARNRISDTTQAAIQIRQGSSGVAILENEVRRPRGPCVILAGAGETPRAGSPLAEGADPAYLLPWSRSARRRRSEVGSQAAR